MFALIRRSGRVLLHRLETRIPLSIFSFVVVCVVVVSLLRLIPALAHNSLSSNHTTSALQSGLAPADTAVTMYKNDTFRTGQNTHETILNTSNVNSGQFGKRDTYPVDGQVYGQPLFMPNVTIQGQSYDVVYVATEHDSVYAFDADQNAPVAPLWHTTFLKTGVTTAPSVDLYSINCCNVNPEVGITSTPVIDPTTGTIYVLAMTKEAGPTYVQRLHALDITTGQERPGSPVVIQGSVPGTGAGSVNGVVTFSAKAELQRCGLLLMNGVIYIAWASFGDSPPYHGWVMGYNASTLQQTALLNTTAYGSDGGIWQSGEALAADPSTGSIFFQTGNGTYDTSHPVMDGGDSMYRLSPQLQILDSFTPFNQFCMEQTDNDLGSGGTLLLPPQPGAHPSELIGGGKEGRLYVVDRTHMGGYTVIANPCSNQSLLTVDKVIQEPHLGIVVGGVFSTPVYWQGPSATYLYESGTADQIKAFPLVNGLIASHSSSKTPETLTFPGANLALSSNGSAAGSGILWALAKPGVLYAYDATNLGSELYNSNQAGTRDTLPSYLHFTVPTVANGRVYIGTDNSLVIFGELGYNNTGISNDSAPTTANFDGGGSSYSEQALTSVGLAPGAHFVFNGVTFTWPSSAPGTPDNYASHDTSIGVPSLSGATTLAFLGSASGGPSSCTVVITYTDNTTQTFTLTFSDWTLNAGKSKPAPGNSVAATMTYRNTPTGKQTRTVDIFYVEVALEAGKTAATVTLPTAANQGVLHIFAIGLK